MVTAGIIAEYNPFHNGHQFHIEETRRETGADFVIAVMSGNFVQRGAPALLDKFTRARMALEGGADLILELPAAAVLSHAEGFAAGGVCLLERSGVTDWLSFGCEDSGEDALFLQTARVLAGEPAVYRETLAAGLRAGESFPKARERAALSCLQPASEAERENIRRFLSRPNNTLGLEYQKAILKYGCRLKTCRVSRRGSGYHSREVSSPFASATAIRSLLLAQTHADGTPAAALQSQVPPSVLTHLLAADQQHALLREHDFSSLLFYALLKNKDRLDAFHPSGTDLAARTHRLLEDFTDWDSFVLLVKSKHQTYTGVSRYFARILLNLDQEYLQAAARCQYAPYARVLGFRQSAAPLLKELRRKTDIPVLMQPAKADRLLSKDGLRLLQSDLDASELYRHVLFSRCGRRLRSDFRQPLIVL